MQKCVDIHSQQAAVEQALSCKGAQTVPLYLVQFFSLQTFILTGLDMFGQILSLIQRESQTLCFPVLDSLAESPRLMGG